MSSENRPNFERDLAQVATPDGIDDIETVEPINDPAESLNRGLTNLYYKYLDQVLKQKKERLIRNENAEEIIARIDALSVKDLGFEVSKYTTIERAKEIMGLKMFFGQEEVKQAFGIEITEQIPPIPFSSEALERAKTLGQFLVLRVNQTADGQPLTMEKIDQLVQPKFDREGKEKVLNAMMNWYIEEEFFTTQTPKLEWALTSCETIPGSENKNYLEQTNALVTYLETQVFADEMMPSEYRDAIIQFNDSKDKIRRLLMVGDWRAASQKLSKLKINQLTRHSPVEALYDDLIYFRITDKRILESECTWTSALDLDDNLVFVGNTGAKGAYVAIDEPNSSYNSLSVLFSRCF